MLRLVCLALFLTCVACGSGDNALKDWFDTLSDFKGDCGDSDAVNSVGEDLFHFVDCDEPGARYDYRIKFEGGGKPKRGKSFSGSAILHLAHDRGENGKFNAGFKLGKCFRVDKSVRAVRAVQGKIKEDRFVGRLVLTFDENVVLVVWASEKDGAVRGIRRTFVNQKLTNVTSGEGDLLLYKDEFSYFHLSTGEARRSSLDYYVTKDFTDILKCSRTDSQHLTDCRRVQGVKSVANPKACTLRVTDIFTDEQESADLFSLNLGTGDLYNQANENPFESFCSAAADAAVGEEEAVKEGKITRTQASIRKWLNVMGDQNKDPFWMLPASDEPLDVGPDGTAKVDIHMKQFEKRRKYLSPALNLISSDRTLGSGRIKKGHVTFSVPDASTARLPDWRAPLSLVASDYHNGDALKVGMTFNAGGNSPLESTGRFVVGRLHKGKLHGMVRMFQVVSNDPKGHCSHKIIDKEALSFVGKFQNGIPTGYCWRGVAGGAFIVGAVDSEGDFTGSDIAYVYPDLKTAIVGEFKDGILVSGQEAEVSGSSCEGGIRKLEFSSVSGPTFQYDPMTKDSLGDQPTVSDPLDKRYVRLDRSAAFPEAGQGSFANEFIPAGQTYVLYGGNMWDNPDARTDLINKTLPEDYTDDQKEAVWKYRYGMSVCGSTVDLPPEYEDTSKYTSTIGHKANHKFIDTNVRFSHLDTPRFGVIASMTSTADIAKGEEIFIHYGYNPNGNAPRWYKALYQKLLEEQPELAPQIAEELEKKKKEEEAAEKALQEEQEEAQKQQ